MFLAFSSFPTNSISSSKLISKRMYAIETARNGSSYGLLTSSNSLLNLPSTIHTLLDRIKELLDKNNRQYYTFLMNTLSITKMNNFERTIDVYVLCSSCSESIWLSPEHKQFNIPFVSIADIVQAFDRTDEDLSANYSFDLTRPVLYHITDVKRPAYGSPLKEIGYMQHRALVDRVNQDFSRVRDVSVSFFLL